MYQSNFGHRLSNGLTIGFECEFFLVDTKKNLVVPDYSYPVDEFPLIIEARSNPSDNVLDAYQSLLNEFETLKLLAKSKKARVSVENWREKQEGILSEVMKKHNFIKKEDIVYQNFLGLDISYENKKNYAAGFHLSLKKEETHSYTSEKKEAKSYTYSGIFDFIKYFRAIDIEFYKEIGLAKRTRGFYSVTDDGRAEYRSLPATIILDKTFYPRLAKVLKAIDKD